jgi:hypothetical protein
MLVLMGFLFVSCFHDLTIPTFLQYGIPFHKLFPENLVANFSAAVLQMQVC